MKILVIFSRLQEFQKVLVLGLTCGAVVLIVGETLKAVLVKTVLAEKVDGWELQGMMTCRAPKDDLMKNIA